MGLAEGLGQASVVGACERHGDYERVRNQHLILQRHEKDDPESCKGKLRNWGFQGELSRELVGEEWIRSLRVKI